MKVILIRVCVLLIYHCPQGNPSRFFALLVNFAFNFSPFGQNASQIFLNAKAPGALRNARLIHLMLKLIFYLQGIRLQLERIINYFFLLFHYKCLHCLNMFFSFLLRHRYQTSMSFKIIMDRDKFLDMHPGFFWKKIL